MFRWRRLLTLLPALATLVVMLTGTTQAALLDIGPPVPVVIGSTAPNMGHGFPAWFRDSNRVPLQLCIEVVPGCLLLAADLPNPAAPPRFPDNMPGEIFYYSAEALIGPNLLFSGVEMNFVDNGDGTYEQVGFARVRIRIDSTVAGDYVVTTPWKQYFFTVDQATIDANGGIRVINATEDIGLGANGVFTGILSGSVDPFAYSEGAPFITPNGSFLGDGTPRPLVGSKFIDPNTGQPANIFRIEGPPGFTTVSTNLFSVTGKLYDIAPVPTPLTVDRVTYSRTAQGMQYSTFATTQAISNQTVPTAPFPQNFALTGALSALEVAGTGIPTLPMTTNNPEDGKFFATSGIVADPGTLPATVTVTNTADTPVTTKVAPFVDDIVISEAVYNPSTGILRVAAVSGDAVTVPTLQLFYPGEALPAGTLANGQISVQLPLAIDGKSYVIPPPTVIVNSSLGGSASAPVQVSMPGAVTPATGVAVAATLTSPQLVNTAITFIASGQGGNGNYEYRFWLNSGTGFSVVQNYSEANTFVWTPNTAGAYDILVDVRTSGSTVVRDAFARINFYQIRNATTPATAVSLTPNIASPQTPGTAITFSAAASGGSGPYEYRFWINSGTGFLIAQNYSTANTFVWTPTVTGKYDIMVDVRNVGSTVVRDAFNKVFLYTIQPAAATGVSITPNLASPQAPGTPVTFTASGTGGSGQYEYRFWLNSGSGFVVTQNYSTLPTWTWIPSATGAYDILVDVRSVGSTTVRDALNRINLYRIQ